MSPHYYSNRYPRKPKTLAKSVEQWEGWGWTVFFCQLIIAFGFLAFGLMHMARAAASHEPGDNRGAYLQNMRSTASVSSDNGSNTSVQGALSWSNGVGKISDESSGKIYVLSNADGVKALWDSGVRYVAVQGHVSNGTSLSVVNVVTP